MSLEFESKNYSTYSKLTLKGKCTIYFATKLKKILLETVTANENILIDLEQVSDIDTAGLQIFISAKNTAKKNNKKIKFSSHPSCVIALLDLYGLTSYFGDKIILSTTDKKHFNFQYGIKKLPSYIY